MIFYSLFRTNTWTRVNDPLSLLRIEGLALCLAAVTAFKFSHGSWWLFGILLLSPDLSMIAYALNAKIGAVMYNLFHTTTFYLLIAGFGLFASSHLAVEVAAIGLAHIGFDRLMGYGLKYPSRFTDTHLTRLAQQVE